MSTDSSMSASTPSTTTLEKFASDVTGTFKDIEESSAMMPFTELENLNSLRKMSVDSDSSRVTTGKGDLDLSSEWQPRSESFISSVSTSSQRYL